MKNRAVFLDRDGTINEDVHYLSDPKMFKLLPGAAEAIKLLNMSSLKSIVVTNQAGVARGFFTEETVKRIHEEMKHQLAEKGAYIDAIYYCPHHATEGIGKYKKNCWCRKPNPGMLQRAANDLDLDLESCYLVGDKIIDVETGKKVGCTTFLILTGDKPQQMEHLKKDCLNPDFILRDLYEAVKKILEIEDELL